MRVSQAVAEGTRALETAGIESARLDAALLVGKALGWSRTKLYTYPQEVLEPDAEAVWRGLLRRRVSREPLPYLLGEWEFYGRSFLVTPAVLIPRPETELLVEGLLARRPWGESGRPLLADVGTGSGCIGLTLADAAPETIGIMTDASADALEVARRNAGRLGVADRVEFRHAAFPKGLEDVEGRLDVLVSNPPYIAEKDQGMLPPEVRQFEPQEALFSGADGLDLLRLLLEKGRKLLRPGGWIALEFGIGQAEALERIARQHGYTELAIEPDLARIPRALFAQNPFEEP